MKKGAALLLLLAACGAPDAREAWERAVGALRAGDLRAADTAAREAADADASYAPFASFVRGNVAFARSERGEIAAKDPAAPPSVMERAVADAEDAVAYWRAAARSRADWPEARRNVERGLLRLQRLRERKKEGEGGQPGPDGQPPEGAPPSPDGTPPPPPEGEEGDQPELERSELAPEEVRALLEIVAKKEARKRELRKSRRDVAGAAVERDW